MESSLPLYHLEHRQHKESIDKNQYAYQDKLESKNIHEIWVHEDVIKVNKTLINQVLTNTTKNQMDIRGYQLKDRYQFKEIPIKKIPIKNKYQ